jgi:hypothetical protein
MLELGVPKAVGGESLFSTHVCSAIWGSTGLGESMQRPGGTEHLGLKVAVLFVYILSSTTSQEGKKQTVLI